jgi:hypothetical protein
MLPVILLAFANDKQNTGAGYLRGLTQERNAIRDALMKAEENGLCQVIVEPDVTVDRLFDVFQNSAYRDRIASFIQADTRIVIRCCWNLRQMVGHSA